MFILTTIIHELGHMLLGILAGYKCCGISVLYVGIIKIKGRWRLKVNKTIPIGRCWLVPKSKNNNPVLASLGGCIANITIGVIMMGIAYFSLNNELRSIISIAFGGCNLCLGISNLIRKGGIADGDTAKELLSHASAKKAYNSILEIEYDLMEGKGISSNTCYLPVENTLVLEANLYECMREFDEAIILEEAIDRKTSLVNVIEKLNVLAEADTEFNFSTELYTELILCSWWSGQDFAFDMYEDIAERESGDNPRIFMCKVINEIISEDKDMGLTLAKLKTEAKKFRKMSIYDGLWKTIDLYIDMAGMEQLLRENFDEISGFNFRDSDYADIPSSMGA